MSGCTVSRYCHREISMMKKKCKLAAPELAASLLLTVILNMNAIRTILRVSNNVYTYLIFILYFTAIGAICCIEKKRIKANFFISLAVLLYFIVALLYMLVYGYDEINQLLKFATCVCIASTLGVMSHRAVINTVEYAITFSTLYALYAILFRNSLYNQLISSGESNYLNITLPIGLGLTLALSRFLVNSNNPWNIAWNCISSLIQTIALLNYSARGNLMFPFVILITLMLYTGRLQLKNFPRNAILFGLVAMTMYYLLLNVANVYLMQRFSRLFLSIADETRVPLYSFYISYILEHANYIIGIGFGRSAEILHATGFTENYPHNFILELVGEGGIVGILLLLSTTIELFRAEIKWKIENEAGDKKLDLQENNALFLYANGGLLFFLLNYFKSYSIYDGYQLFIFIGIILSQNLKQTAKADI